MKESVVCPQHEQHEAFSETFFVLNSLKRRRASSPYLQEGAVHVGMTVKDQSKNVVVLSQGRGR